MENNLRKSIHIEFYGLPGCGKSTISHYLAGLFREKGYEVYEPSYYSDHMQLPFIRKIKKATQTVKYSIFNNKEYKRLKSVVIANGYNTKKHVWRQMVNIVPKIIVYSKNKPGLFFWDEGLIQSSVSLAFNSHMDISRTINSLLGKQNKYVLINIDSTIEQALAWMSERNTNDSRVEKEENFKKKYRMMEKYLECINAVSGDICVRNSLWVSENDYTKKMISNIEEKIQKRKLQ